MAASASAYYTHAMTRIGIIVNVQAGRNQRQRGRVRARLQATPFECREVSDLASIREATRYFAARSLDILAVSGGDGTAQGVLTQLLRSDVPLPDLAILPGGTTNMTAHDLSGPLSVDRALNALGSQSACAPEARERVRRRLLRVEVPGRDVEYGLFLGCGVILRGMRHFRERVAARGLRGEAAAGISLLRAVAAMACRESNWTAGEAGRYRLEGGTAVYEGAVMLLATTLDRLLLGLRPWWGAPAGPIRVTAIHRRPRALLRLAPAIVRGRRHRLLSPPNGYNSVNVDGLDVGFASGFALDGQIFSLRDGATARVRTTEPITFLRLVQA